MPAKLNFSIFGNMKFIADGINVNCDDFHIGQGHHLLENNWWLCSPNCVTIPGKNQGTCTCDGGSVYITEGSKDNEFYAYPSANATEPINFLE